MKRRNSGRLGAKLSQWFPERQIYHRAQGRVAYITLPTGIQVACAGAVCLLAAWLIFASASFALRGHVIDIRTAASQSQLARYERLLQEARSREASALALLESRTQEFRDIAQDLEQRHQTLRAVLGQAADIITPAALQNAPAEDAAAGADSAARAEGGQTVAMLRGDSAPQPPAARLSEMRAEQERMMAVAETAAETRIVTAREAIEMTGLSEEDLTQAVNTEMGGPLVEADISQIAPGMELDQAFAARVTEVAARLAEAEELERAIEAAPLRAPVADDYRLTSRFGGRVDPFTRKSAYHTGLDLGAYFRAPVVSTASGTVSFAGWKGGYGRTIEIDHGNGFKTRYGHLSQIHVEAGETVEAGHNIGSMGSTGRSTGTHLHYEVWFRGEIRDPAKFLRAGEHVQQS